MKFSKFVGISWQISEHGKNYEDLQNDLPTFADISWKFWKGMNYSLSNSFFHSPPKAHIGDRAADDHAHCVDEVGGLDLLAEGGVSEGQIVVHLWVGACQPGSEERIQTEWNYEEMQK